MQRPIPYARQSIDEADIAAVVEALRSDVITGGPKLLEFERAVAERVGARHAVAVSSGTAALHLALLAAEVPAGSRVVTSPNSFVASANCAAYVGAVPDFADIDPTTLNLDPDALRGSWCNDTRAVVTVDYAGRPCDMPAIAEIARSHGAFVIEDACHAIGSAFAHDGEVHKVGGHRWADATVFSFHPVKMITSAEGGMLVTDRDDWAECARALRSHGIVRAPELFEIGTCEPTEEHGPWYYEMLRLGFNYRLSELHCALGLSQLAKLDEFSAGRRRIVAHYNEAFVDLPWLVRPAIRSEFECTLTAWHLYTVRIDFERLGRTRTQVMQELRERGVGTQVLYIPIHLQPWYRRTYGYRPGKCPIAEAAYSQSLSLPLFPAMTEDEVARVVAAVRELAQGVAR